MPWGQHHSLYHSHNRHKVYAHPRRAGRLLNHHKQPQRSESQQSTRFDRITIKLESRALTHQYAPQHPAQKVLCSQCTYAATLTAVRLATTACCHQGTGRCHTLLLPERHCCAPPAAAAKAGLVDESSSVALCGPLRLARGGVWGLLGLLLGSAAASELPNCIDALMLECCRDELPCCVPASCCCSSLICRTGAHMEQNKMPPGGSGEEAGLPTCLSTHIIWKLLLLLLVRNHQHSSLSHYGSLPWLCEVNNEA